MSNKRKVVTLYCDGACAVSGTRAGHGGWAALLIYQGQESFFGGHQCPATSQQMEILALLEGLRRLDPEPVLVDFFSDSQYVVNGCNRWLASWQENGWRGAHHKPIAHPELWAEVAAFKRRHQLQGLWIASHAPALARTAHQEQNARCDERAVAEAWKSYQTLHPDDEMEPG